MVRIVPLETTHLDAVARLHMAHLRTNYRGYPGMQLLICYYDTLAKSDVACGYVAIEHDRVLGFVCGVWDFAQLHSSLLKRKLPSLLLWNMLRILSIRQFSKQLLRTLDSQNRNRHSPAEYELRPIVVDTQFRGTGVAKLLVDRLIVDAAERGFEQLFLHTEEDNISANAFYHKLGFQLISKSCIGKINYLRYEIATSQTSRK